MYYIYLRLVFSQLCNSHFIRIMQFIEIPSVELQVMVKPREIVEAS